jgi:hypothetical protein
MPISSYEIAQLNASFQQQSMQNLQYSHMIGMMSQQGALPGQQHASAPADMLAGRTLNMGMSMAAPIASFGLGMAGLDPMGMAMRGGMAGFARYGMAGAVGGAAAMALPAMAVGSAVSWGAQQMMEGAHQQQNLNNALRSSFTQQTAFGRGFQHNEMGQIGKMMRDMTHQFGPGGEIVSMQELTRLAQTMGQQGGGQHMQSVQEFKQKFQELVRNVKTVAKELGTSLTQAQELMGSLRGSGVFGGNSQMQALMSVKNAALGGNVSQSEIMASGNIGSQIARSLGGRGRAGFSAGVKAGGTVSGALRTGLLSEEDIYNATGMEGEQGRQALSAAMMSTSAAFLKSGRGRRVYASLAGKDGRMDQASLDDYEAADGFSVSGTMKHAYGNLGKVGRANFIRNEGRLRGEALAADPLIGVRQTMRWLENRGLDTSSDLGMIALQRQLKAGGASVGHDELEAMVKMVRGQDAIKDNQDFRVSQDKYLEEMGNIKKTTGIAGMKNKLAQARETVQGRVQQAGADLFQSTSDEIEQIINKMSGVYVQRFSKEVDEAFRDVKQGKKGGLEGLLRATGQVGITARGGDSWQLAKQTYQGSFSSESGVTPGNVKAYQAAGYNIGANAQRDMDWADRASRAAQGPVNKLFFAGGGAMRPELRSARALGIISGTGEGLVDSMQDYLNQDRFDNVHNDFISGDKMSRVTKTASLLRGAGMDAGAMFATPEEQRMRMLGGIGRSAGDRAALLGQGLVTAGAGKEGEKWAGRGRAAAMGIGASLAATTTVLSGGLAVPIAGAISSIVGKDRLAAAGDWALDKAGGLAKSLAGVADDGDLRKIAGGIMDSEEGRKTMRGVLSSDAERRRQAIEASEDKMLSLEGAGTDKDTEAQRLFHRNAMLAGKVTDVMDREGLSLEEASEKVSASFGKKGKYSAADVQQAFKGILAPVGLEDMEASQQQSQKARSGAVAERRRMREGGDAVFADHTSDRIQLDEKTRKALEGTGIAEGVEKAINMSAELDTRMGADNTEAFSQVAAGYESVESAVGVMSVKERRERAKKIREGGHNLDIARRLEGAAALEEKYKNLSKGPMGDVTAASSFLGAGIDPREMAKFSKLSKGEQAEQLILRAGGDVSSEEGKKRLEQLTGILGGKGSAYEKGKGLQSIANDVQKERTDRERKEKNPELVAMAEGIKKMSGDLTADKIGTAVGAQVSKLVSTDPTKKP